MNPTLIFWWNTVKSGEILLKEIRFHTAKQIIEFCSCAKFATSRDISSWMVFTKRGSDGKSSVCGDPPYCRYQTGTCRTCGSGNSPRAAYTCHLLAECPTIQQGTNVVCPIVLITREYAVLAHTWTTVRERGRRRSCGTTDALYPLTLRACERAQLYRQKWKTS